MRPARFFTLVFFLSLILPAAASAREMENFPVVKLQSLDKVTARTMTFEANVGNTVKFGSLYIKIQACAKAPPVEQPESAAFLQIWEVKSKTPDNAEPKAPPPKEEAQWIFSGWMFASSPALSHMDHPIYDVWVLDCLSAKGQKPEEKKPADAEPGEGEIESKDAPAAPEAPAPGEAAPADDTPVERENLSPMGD